MSYMGLWCPMHGTYYGALCGACNPQPAAPPPPVPSFQFSPPVNVTAFVPPPTHNQMRFQAAVAAMQGMLSGPADWRGKEGHVAEFSVEMADALLAKLEKERSK